MAILEVEGLIKRFGGLTALNNLSFSVGKGEVMGIVGPNGSGKTTAFNLITGFIKPDSGNVFLKGQEITNLKPHVIVRRGVARTFQVVRVFRHLSVYENIKAAKLLKAKKGKSIDEEIAQVLSQVGLMGKETEEAINLPIGDLKRLEIGRALATGPDVLLLDEPFSGLTHLEVNEIASLLRDLIEAGMTIVIVEHVLRELRKLTEEIIVLDFGEKIASGRFEHVINQQIVKEAYLGGGTNASSG
jgi:branched-chain amino acid transport system ATP-binding protein